jgi:hypothetical protein
MVDVKVLSCTDIKGDQLKTRIFQEKTDEPLPLTLHPIARAILEKRKTRFGKIAEGKVFRLPSHVGTPKAIAEWCKNAGIEQHINWHCARLSFRFFCMTPMLIMQQSLSLFSFTTPHLIVLAQNFNFYSKMRICRQLLK